MPKGIDGMSCNHCVVAVTKALNEIDGIKDATVDLQKGEAAFKEVMPVDMNVVYVAQAIPQIDPPEAEKRAISGWKLDRDNGGKTLH
ncbi:MAG: heavy metal translocating P-type ATPase [Desulfobacterales bacterium]|nr:heavy metal translocating P-type ATPase [Desulfobacterales bacterium]